MRGKKYVVKICVVVGGKMNKQNNKDESVSYKEVQHVAKNASREATKRRQRYKGAVLLAVSNENEASCANPCFFDEHARYAPLNLNLDTLDETASLKLMDR